MNRTTWLTTLFVFAMLFQARTECLAQTVASGSTIESRVFQADDASKLQYWLYLPPGYADSQEKWPLIIFLHGSGERGDNLDAVKKHGPPRLTAEGKDYPFVIISPQCPSNQRWNATHLDQLLSSSLKNLNLDPHRVYLTGLSMGGSGTWSWAAQHPQRFAAIAPICGGGDPTQAEKLKDIPTWVFHGARDTAVPLSRSQQMIDAMKAAGGRPEFTIYPEAGHDSWTETYNNPKLYEWFLEQRRQ